MSDTPTRAEVEAIAAEIVDLVRQVEVDSMHPVASPKNRSRLEYLKLKHGEALARDWLAKDAALADMVARNRILRTRPDLTTEQVAERLGWKDALDEARRERDAALARLAVAEGVVERLRKAAKHAVDTARGVDHDYQSAGRRIFEEGIRCLHVVLNDLDADDALTRHAAAAAARKGQSRD